MFIDSTHEWKTGVTYSEIVGFVDRSQARPAGASIQANYSREGNVVTFKATVTNSSGVLLSAANKAAVHAIVYEDYHAQKTNRIGERQIPISLPWKWKMCSTGLTPIILSWLTIKQ